MTGVKTITKKALHHLAGHQLVSMQEAVHIVDEQELVICSDSMTNVSITQGQVLRDEQETDKKRYIITVYQNRPKKTKISLWNNSFTASLSTPHSGNHRTVTQITMMKGMPSQTMNIISWFPRVWIAYQDILLIMIMHERCSSYTKHGVRTTLWTAS